MNLIIEGDNIVAVWSDNLNTLETLYPDNPEMLEKYEQFNMGYNSHILNKPDLYQPIRDNSNKIIGVKQKERIPRVFTKEEKIEGIKQIYQDKLRNLTMAKMDAEMMGEPVGLIIAEYRQKKVEMEEAIRNVN